MSLALANPRPATQMAASYELRYPCFCNPERTLSFPCNAQGCVELDALSATACKSGSGWPMAACSCSNRSGQGGITICRNDPRLRSTSSSWLIRVLREGARAVSVMGAAQGGGMAGVHTVIGKCGPKVRTK